MSRLPPRFDERGKIGRGKTIVELGKLIDMEIVDVDVPQGRRKERWKRPVPAELGKRRKRVGRRPGNEAHAAVHILNKTASRKPAHAGNPEAWVQVLRGGSQRGNEVRNVGRGNWKGKGAVRQPTRRKGK